MKKIIVFCLLLFIGFYAEAQVKYGVRAGLNRTNIKSIHGGSNPRYGFYVGGFAQVPFDAYNNQFYFQPELNYSQQGEQNVKTNIDEVYKFDYIHIPLLFRAYFSEKDKEFFGDVGPQIGFMINDEVEIRNDRTEVANPNEKYRKFDLGIVVGLGFSLNRKFEIQARYNIGFVDVVDGDTKDAKNWNSNLHAGLVYIF